MKKLITLTLLLTAAFALYAGGGKEQSKPPATAPASAESETQPAAAAPVRYFEGNGGKGTSIAILPPQGVGLSKDLDYLPALVQGEFMSNFSGYSAIDVMDRMAIESQFAELYSGYYPDDMEGVITLGHLPPTTYLMMGRITKTSSGYALQITVNKNADGLTAAAYSGTCTVAELDNFTGIRRSSQELLEKMGVELNGRAKTELAGSAAEREVNGQTFLSKGITAQRSGTVVETLAYYYQAAAYDPSLREAVNRASVLSTTISSGNIGENVRNDIAWRNEWVKLFQEAYNFFLSHSPIQAELVYDPALTQGKIDYKNNTVELTFPATFYAQSDTANKIIEDLRRGLEATGRNGDWKLNGWWINNWTGKVDEKTCYVFARDYSFEAALLNDRGEVIAVCKEDDPQRLVYIMGYDTDRLPRLTDRFYSEFRGPRNRGLHDKTSTLTFVAPVDKVTDTLSLRITNVFEYFREPKEGNRPPVNVDTVNKFNVLWRSGLNIMPIRTGQYSTKTERVEPSSDVEMDRMGSIQWLLNLSK